MNSEVRALVKKAETLGFTLRKETSGGGHLTLEHPNGVYVMPSTPSDWRSGKNAIAELERIAGQKLERPNHRRSRKGSTLRVDPEVAASRRRHREAWDAKAAERESARAAEVARRASAKKAADDDRRRREIEDLMR